MQLHLNPSSKAMNGLGGVYSAIGEPGTLTPTFNPVTGDLNFSFSTLEGAHLVLGVASYEGIMQMSIIALGESVRVLSSARIVLNPDGSEGRVHAASEAQLQELSDRFNAARGIMETFVITVDEKGALTYQFVTGAARETAAGVIERHAAAPAAAAAGPSTP